MSDFEGINWNSFFVIEIIIIVIIKYNDIETTTTSAIFLYTIIWLGIFMSAETYIWQSRYNVGQIIADNFHGSFDPSKVVQKGRYSIFQIGYVKYPVPMDGKLQTLILPTDNIKKFKDCWVSNCFVERKHPISIPIICTKFLSKMSNDYNMQNIWFGDFSNEILFRNKEVEKLKEELDLVNIVSTKQQKALEDVHEYHEEFFETSTNISNKENKIQAFMNKIKNKFKGEEDE